MNSRFDNPFRLFFNPFAFWTDLAFKTGEALWAPAHAAADKSNTAAKVAVIPTADAPPPNAQEATPPAEELLASGHAEGRRTAKVAVLPVGNARRKTRPMVRHASKAVRSRATGTKPRSKAKRRARR